MRLLYNIGIYIYYTFILLASIFNDKAKKWIKGRKEIFTQLELEVNPSEKIIWFHAASLGEFEQGRPVIEAFNKKHPNYKILLTFFSPVLHSTANSGFSFLSTIKSISRWTLSLRKLNSILSPSVSSRL